MYNFECDFKTLVEEAGVLDKLGSFAGLVTDILDNMDPLNMGSESKGKGVVILNDTNLTLNGGNNYGLFAGKNGSIEVMVIYKSILLEIILMVLLQKCKLNLW